MEKKNFYDRLSERYNKRKLEKIQLKKKYDSMSLEQLNSFQEIIDRNENNGVFLVWLPLKIIFMSGIFTLVLLLAFQIDIREHMKTLVLVIASLLPWFILIFFIAEIMESIKIARLKKELLRRI